jgi:mono/diheme cytochrome c family protein
MSFRRCLGTMAGLGLSLSGLNSSALRAATGSPADPAGKAVYDQHCAACHGDTGDGNGPAAVWLYPKPRNFSAGLYKIQSTPSGSLPTDEDLHRSITRGLGGSSMPAFNY